MARTILKAVGLAAVVALAMMSTGQSARSQTEAAATPLVWKKIVLRQLDAMPYGSRHPSVALDKSNNFVRLRGAYGVWDVENPYVVAIPPHFRAAGRIYLPAETVSCRGPDPCVRYPVRLRIQGGIALQFNDDELGGPISLEGLAFSKDGDATNEADGTPLKWSPIALANGWAAEGNGTRSPAVAIDKRTNFVHLRGAVVTAVGNSSTTAFRLPPSLRPAGRVRLPVAACDGSNDRACRVTEARIVIDPDGQAYFERVPDAPIGPSMYLSLEGVSFSKDGAAVGVPDRRQQQSQTEAAMPLTWSTLAPRNGWTVYGNGTRAPAAAIDKRNNFVHLRGALYAADGGSSTPAFRLPPALRPAGEIMHVVDSCDATYARIVIGTDGWVRFQGEADALECSVSIEGVNFAKDGRDR